MCEESVCDVCVSPKPKQATALKTLAAPSSSSQQPMAGMGMVFMSVAVSLHNSVGCQLCAS